MSSTDKVFGNDTRKGRKKTIVAAVAIVLLLLIAYFNLTIFIVQPIGAIPEGRTVILWRQSSRLHFIDSADSVCLRIQGNVSLLCRGVVMGTIVKNNPILLRLPYSHALYLFTTDGQDFDR